jgi:hypothetical protein
MRLELANPPYVRRRSETFSGILLEDVHEISVAYEATKRAMLRSRVLQRRGLFLSEQRSVERHTVFNQAVISFSGRLMGLDAINRNAASAITSANAAQQQDVPLYVWDGIHPDVLARAIVDFDQPFPNVKPLRENGGSLSLSGNEAATMSCLVPELSDRILSAQNSVA